MPEVFGRIIEAARLRRSILMVEQIVSQVLGIADKGYVIVQGRDTCAEADLDLLADAALRRFFWEGEFLRYIALALLAFAGTVASGKAFAQASSFVCLFDTECSRDTNCKAKEMQLTFFVDEQGQAFMQGNVDLVQVMPLVGDDAVSFVEPAGSGIVQSTSILNDGYAVHSRHTAFLGKFVTSQWHGKCSSFGGNN